MKTTTRIVALGATLAVGLGGAACSKTESTPTAPAAASSVASPGTSSPVETSSSAVTTPSETASETPSESVTPSDTATSADAGGSGEAAQIIDKAKANALAATSGAFKGEIEQNGEKMKIDFKGTADGKTADVAIETEKDGKARVISVPGGLYVQADATFWKAQGAPAAVQKAGDKFIKAPTSSSSMTKNLSLKTFLDKAFGSVDSNDLAANVTEENVNGVDCWVLIDKKGGKEEGALYVSKDKNEIVRFTGTTKSPGQLDFSQWNADLDIKAPPAGQIMNLS